MSDHIRNTGPMLASLRCGAKTVPATRAGRRRCTAKSAAACTAVHLDPVRQRQTRTRKHGMFSRDAIAERRQIQVLLGETRRMLEEMK